MSDNIYLSNMAVLRTMNYSQDNNISMKLALKSLEDGKGKWKHRLFVNYYKYPLFYITQPYTRLHNFIKGLSRNIESIKGEAVEINESLLLEKEEKELYYWFRRDSDEFLELIKVGSFTIALHILSSYSYLVNQFMDNVHINVDDKVLRKNRIALVDFVYNTYRMCGAFETY